MKPRADPAGRRAHLLDLCFDVVRYGGDNSDAPLTAGSRGVALWMSVGITAIAALTAAGLAKPAFPNEPAIAAIGYGAGALVAGIAVLRKEPRNAALAWLAVNVACAILVFVLAVPLGLSHA